jgi:hypothetical protein
MCRNIPCDVTKLDRGILVTFVNVFQKGLFSKMLTLLYIWESSFCSKLGELGNIIPGFWKLQLVCFSL